MTNVYEAGSDLRIAWEPVTYQSPKSAMQADTAVGRLAVSQTKPRARSFHGYINGEFIGCWDTLEMAMAKTSRKARDIAAAGLGDER